MSKNTLLVRVADEIVVNLMRKACGVEYDEASRMVPRHHRRSYDSICEHGIVVGSPNRLCGRRTDWTASF